MSCALYLILVLLRVVVANDCINQQCDKALAIPSTENQKITFQPCDACTMCPNSTPRTIQAWWYYYYVNGTRTDDIRALTIEERQYQINLQNRSSLVTLGTPHKVFTNYIYNCGGTNHSSLQNIRMELVPVGNVSTESPNEMPVSEGSTVVIYCKTGLSNSLGIQLTFQHLDHEEQCNPVNVDSGVSTWFINHTDNMCTLYIENIQPSDSGDYFCKVGPVLSSPLHVEVASGTPPTPTTHSTSTKLILFTTIPIVGVVLITGLILLVVYKVYNFTASHRHGDRPSVSGGVYGTINYNEDYHTQTGTGSSQSNQGSHAAKWGVLSGGSQPSRGSHQSTLKDVLLSGETKS